MKKLLSLAVVLALPWAGFAQGRVNFANAGFAIQTNSSGGGTGPANFAATPLRIGLFIGAAGEVNPANLSLALNNVNGNPAWATNQSAPFAGMFNGGNNFEIQGNAGTPISFQIRAWSINYTTYGEAVTAWNAGMPGVLFGLSTIGGVTPSTGAAPTPNLFGVNPGQIGAFQVSVPLVPEPSSIGLGLLGLGVLALFRRRK